MHDTLYGLFVDPNKLLKAAGLTQGQNVLEVGCGPGFFTVAAAELVGKSGRLYTLDINPAAVERVGQKVSGAGLTNVKVRVANASSTGLPDASVDVVFFFGIVHSLKDLDPILKEMHRILKNNGVLSAQRSSWSERDLLNRFTKHRLFHFIGKERRIYRFENISGQVNDGAHKEQRIEF